MEDKLTSHSTRCRKKLSHLIFGMFLLVFPAGAGGKTVTGPVMPGNLKDYVAAIQTGELGNSRKSIRYKSVSKNVTRDCRLCPDGGCQKRCGSGFLPASRLHCLARIVAFPVLAVGNHPAFLKLVCEKP